MSAACGPHQPDHFHTVFELNFGGAYWSDTNNPSLNTQLEALQFAAKIQEAFIYASLTAILLCTLTFQLCGDGIPLGSIVASYRFTTLSNVWSRPFWAGMLSPMQASNRSWLRRAASAFVLGLVAVLAILVGPATAVALIPKLGWWPILVEGWNVANGESQSTMPNKVYMFNYQAPIWPVNITASCLPSYYMELCTGLLDEELYDCPSGGFSTMVIAPLAFNFSMPDYGFLRSVLSETIGTLSYHIGDEPDRHTSTSIASTPSLFLASVLASLGRLRELASYENSSMVGNSPARWARPRFEIEKVGTNGPVRPVVQVQCAPFKITSETVTFPHNAFNTPPFRSYNSTIDADQMKILKAVTVNDNIYTGNNWTMEMDHFWPKAFREANFVAQDQTSCYFKWVDLSQYFDVAPSAAAIVVFPRPVTALTEGPDAYAYMYATGYLACSVDARWLPTTIWTDPASDNSVYMEPISSVDLLSSLAATKGPRRRTAEIPRSPIHIGLDWAEALNSPITGQNITNMEALLMPISDSYPRLDYLPALLSEAIADGLSRINPTTQVAFQNLTPSILGEVFRVESLESKDVTPIYISYSRYGYAYGTSTVTFKISAVALLLYVIIAVLMIVYLLVTRRTTTAWSSAGDMLALALKSTPNPAVKDSGAGVRDFETRSHQVRVRDIGDGSVELVWPHREDDGALLKKVKAGEKYS